MKPVIMWTIGIGVILLLMAVCLHLDLVPAPPLAY